MSLHYISILAGGACSMNCEFCIGKHIRNDRETAHFAPEKDITSFLHESKETTKTLSISGVNSDPTATKNLLNVVQQARPLYSTLSLHTIEHPYFLSHLLPYIDELVLSVHQCSPMLALDLLTLRETFPGTIRLSSVVSPSGIQDGSDIESFVMQYGRFVDAITVRKNVFTPDYQFPELPYPRTTEIHGQRAYKYYDTTVCLWDYEKANRELRALYLWPDGQVREQCAWNQLHTLPESNTHKDTSHEL